MLPVSGEAAAGNRARLDSAPADSTAMDRRQQSALDIYREDETGEQQTKERQTGNQETKEQRLEERQQIEQQIERQTEQQTEEQQMISGGNRPAALLAVSQEDLELLARVIYAEARGEIFEGQVAVGAVVVNRLTHPQFPKTIREVIYQQGQFTAVSDQQILLEPNPLAFQAAEAALAGQDPTGGAIFYFNPRLAEDDWIKQRPVVKEIGNHIFSI
jgi:N-acetylmuramoyl-L-alanine amidase